MKTLFFSLLLLISMPFAVAQAAQDEESFAEGIDYELIVPAQPGGSDGSVEVTELFWYGCPHCYAFEPNVRDWLADKPDYVEFSRLPAIFTSPRWELHARAFYTAKVLDVFDKMHAVIFHAIHEEKERLDSKADLAELFAENGVSKEEFNSAFDSFAVQSSIRRAADLTKRYGIDGVPTMVVNGKYRVDGPIAGTYDRLIEIVNFLVEKEHAEAAGQ